jgi:hypothetical protein
MPGVTKELNNDADMPHVAAPTGTERIPVADQSGGAGHLLVGDLELKGDADDARTRITSLEATQTSNVINANTWDTLLGFSGTFDGQGGEVVDADTGTHLAASATGYDGSSVPNAGRYAWDATWGRWVRISGTGLSAKANSADLSAVATSGDSDDLSEGTENLLMTTNERSKLAGLPEKVEGVFTPKDRDVRQKKLLFVLTGQSLNVSRENVEQAEVANEYDFAMFNPGVTMVTSFPFATSNVLHCPNFASVDSTVPLNDSDGQGPAIGIASAIAGMSIAGAVFVSVAIGSRTFDVLSGSGPRASLYAAIERGCELIRSEGFDPVVMFYHAHGEADGNSATGYAGYKRRFESYVGMCQLAAAQHMERPGFQAPFIVTYPLQASQGDADRQIKQAIRDASRSVPGVIDAGPTYPWEQRTDLVHPSSKGAVMRGEWVGLAAKDFYENGKHRPYSIDIVDVRLVGGLAYVSFSDKIVKDSSLAVGTSLPGTDGFEWFDDGTSIAISSVTVQGRTAILSLDSTPTGGLGLQELRVAMQSNTPNATVPAHTPGSNIRADEPGEPSWFDPTYTHYRWAKPTIYTDVRG